MPTIVETYEDENGDTINVYESGAVYNQSKGRLIGAPPRAQFTPETAVVAVERRAELKREAIARGAAKVLERTGEWDAPNDIDVAEALGEAVFLKALNPDNPKQVDAARFVLQEMGIAESQTSSTAVPNNFTAVGQQFAELARSIQQIVSDVLAAQVREPAGPVVDGEIRE